MTITIVLLLTMVIAMLLGVVTIPRIVKLANEIHLYDQPDRRKIHKLPIPRLGGVTFLPSVVIAISAVAALIWRYDSAYEMIFSNLLPQHFIAYVAGGFMLFCLGIYDDVHGVGYKYKFAVQIAAASLLCISGLWIASFDHIFFIDSVPYWVGMPLTIIFVVYITNAMNLIDGIDGLASGLSCISFFVAMVLCVMSGELFWAMLATAFMGILITFFAYNVFGGKYKLFMGDAGSLTLGYTLSFIVLHFWQAHPVWNPVLHNIGIVILSTLIIPMFDVVRVFMSRMRDGRNPFLPDKNHIHHKLMRTGLTGRQTMVTILFLSSMFIVGNYIVATEISQTLIILFDIVLFIIMHLVINWFIQRKENQEGTIWNRELN